MAASLLNLLGGAVTAGLGAMALLRPALAAAFTGIRPEGATGVAEIRATYGGFFLVLGAFVLVTRSDVACTVVGAAWLGAAAGRALSVAVDRGTAPRNLLAIAFEAGIGGLLLA